MSYFQACTFGQTLDATDFSCAVFGFSGFLFVFFPREMKVSVRSLYILCKLTNQCSCPEFLAASCRYELKVKLACSVVFGSRISSSFSELKGHEHAAKAVTVGINTCCFISVSRVFAVV